MFKPLAGKTITVIGSSGYVGRAVMNQAYEFGAYVQGVSRSGQPKNLKGWEKEVKWIQGDAMDPTPFSEALRKSDLVVHTIGTLIDSSVLKGKKPGEPGTYEQMNRDTAIRIAECLRGSQTKMVYVSGSAAPPFLKRYLTTKQEAENHLLGMHSQKTLNPIILRPGFIYSWEHRWWSVPLMVDLTLWKCVHSGLEKVIPSKGAVGNFFQEFKVDSAVRLQDVVDACLAPLKMELVGQVMGNSELEEVARKFRRLQQ